jgi:hypothetical protein
MRVTVCTRSFAVCAIFLVVPVTLLGDSVAGVNAGAPIWNGSIRFTDSMAGEIAASGCSWVRINFRIDGNATWTPALLTKYDAIVQAARNHKLEILGLICYEAVPGTQSDWNQNYNTTGLNAYISQFAENAWLLIDRYKDAIKRFEIWNEPDCWSVNPSTNPLAPGCYYIWPKNYANLVAETYKKGLSAGGATFFTASGVSLVTGGLFAHDINGSFATSRGYMSSVYAQASIWNAFHSVAGRRYPWDCFGYHFYLNQAEAVSTAELASYFDDIRAMKKNYGDSSPFLVTEFGWNTNTLSADLQAANLTAACDWMKTQPDIVRAFWYRWGDGDGGWGLIDEAGVPKPAYHAFAIQCGYIPPPAPDLDGDNDVDGADVGLFAHCMTGPRQTDIPEQCRAADFDRDGDVDQGDFSILQRCLSGEGLSVDPACLS